jgi:hypothetical protein
MRRRGPGKALWDRSRSIAALASFISSNNSLLRFGKLAAITVDNGPEIHESGDDPLVSRTLYPLRLHRSRSVHAERKVESFKREVSRRVPESNHGPSTSTTFHRLSRRGAMTTTPSAPSALGNIPPEAFLDRFHAGQLGHPA